MIIPLISNYGAILICFSQSLSVCLVTDFSSLQVILNYYNHIVIYGTDWRDAVVRRKGRRGNSFVNSTPSTSNGNSETDPRDHPELNILMISNYVANLFVFNKKNNYISFRNISVSI